MSDRDQIFRRIRALSELLDNALPIPGTPYRVGLDPILGLFPGIGDYLGAAFSAYIVIQGAKLGVPNATLWQMVWNIIVETIVGIVPVLGDLFDAGWKANVKNVALLEAYLKIPRIRRKKANWGFIILLLGLLFAIVIAISAVSVALLQLILGRINS